MYACPHVLVYASVVCVHARALPLGHPLVVTSRPEGVEAELPALRASGFVVLDLKPLDQKQASFVVEQQLQGNEFFDHLQKFSAVRREQDSLYVAMDKDSRAGLEVLTSPDLFKMPGPKTTAAQPAAQQSEPAQPAAQAEQPAAQAAQPAERQESAFDPDVRQVGACFCVCCGRESV